MKKVNKARKITENDIRNLHYIHENEGLIPDGVTRLEDEDITSAEVITESKKSKVNESNNIAFWVSKRNPGNVKDEANNVLRMLGYRIDPSQTELEEIIKHFHEDYNGDKDYEEYTVMLLGYYYLMFGYTEFYNNYASKYDVTVDEYGVLTGINEDDNEDADIIEFRKLINSDVWKKFKEDWKGTDVYDVAFDAISYVETLPQMINMLKKVFTEYDMLIDYEAGLDKLLKQQSVNEDNPGALTQLTDSDVWQKFKQDHGENSEIYNAAMNAVHNVMSKSGGYHDLSDLITAVKRVLAKYDIISDYETELDKLLSISVNEYKTIGVYKTNDGDVEDLYYIQAGDIILINHKDYGELQCKVKKVDADKNKVYFVTIERGIMGVCGFDKIHGIELVDECQKQPVFVQTKYITFPEGGICYMCYSKVGNRFIDVYCTFGMNLGNCECIKLLNMTEDEFGVINNIMVESDTFEEAKTRVYNSGLVSL